MTIRQRVFLESDVFEREYFDPPDDGDLLAQFHRALDWAANDTADDGLLRRIGIELIDDQGAEVANDPNGAGPSPNGSAAANESP